MKKQPIIKTEHYTMPMKSLLGTLACGHKQSVRRDQKFATCRQCLRARDFRADLKQGEPIAVNAPGAARVTIGYYHKTKGGFFRAYSFVSYLGIGPFPDKHEAIQWIINEAY